MSAIVDAIRAEREQLLAPIAHRLAVLDEMERLATALNGGGPKPSPAEQRPAIAPEKRPAVPAEERPASAPAKRVAPPRPPRTRAGIDGLTERELALLTAIRSKGANWLAIRELGTMLPQHSSWALKADLKTLIGRELVEATGTTSTRRYRAANPDTPASGGPTAATRSGLAGSTPAPARGSSTVLRARVLDHLGRRRLTEQSLADHLNADREHVADVVGKLLLEDKIVLDPDGLYRNVA